jgi:hypothetical protein
VSDRPVHTPPLPDETGERGTGVQAQSDENTSAAGRLLVEQVASRVYDLLRDDLRLERERRSRRSARI